jgi:VWFA-related protein
MLLTSALSVAGFCGPEPQTGEKQPSPAAAGPVIKAETRLVLVDTVVTDKKGGYITDLTQKDFRVWEDNKEQTVKSFSFEQESASPVNGQRRYLILFFDNSTMAPDEQMRARAAAAKFIAANAGHNLAMAIANFGGTLRIAQNFTTDAERLTRAVGGLKQSTVSPVDDTTVEVASLGAPTLGGGTADFGVHTSLLALRSLAKSLASVPGRKTLILLTSGYKVSNELLPEVTAAINECNRSNVAIYPIDVRGLVAGGEGNAVPGTGIPAGPGPTGALRGYPAEFPSVSFVPASLVITSGVTVWPYVQLAWVTGSSSSAPSPAQRGGGGGGIGGGGGSRGGGGGGIGGGRGGTGGGSTGGGRSGNSGSSTGSGSNSSGNYGNYGNSNYYNPLTQPRAIVPQFPPSAADNQQVMFMLASGTGGFVILNTNDLLSGLEKIAREQNQYYLLGYTPIESQEGSCHTIKVKVERAGTIVRARSGYCNVPPQDQLAGDPIEKELEAHTSAEAPGTPGAPAASIADPYFYTGANTARVNVAMEIPCGDIKTEKVKGKLHAELNVLGIAYKPDGTAAARFSDTIKLDFNDKKELQAFEERPLHYENQFEVAPGKYTLKVVYNSGRSFGKVQAPLLVDSWDGKHFVLSPIAFSKEYHKVSAGTEIDEQLLEGRTPLIANGLEIIPSGTNRVKKTDLGVVYVEVYEPLLQGVHPPQVMVQLKVRDRKTGELANDSGLMGLADLIRPGNPVVPIGLRLPLEKLAPGGYRLFLQAVDSAGHGSTVRWMDLDVIE